MWKLESRAAKRAGTSSFLQPTPTSRPAGSPSFRPSRTPKSARHSPGRCRTGMCSASLPETDNDPCERIGEDLASKAFAGLPRSTTSPGQGQCVYLRGRSSMRSDCWIPVFRPSSRHRRLGYARPGARILRQASESCVRGACAVNDEADDDGGCLVRDRAIVAERHPYRALQLEAFYQSLDGRLPQHAIDFLRPASCAVAYDIRHLTSESDGRARTRSTWRNRSPRSPRSTSASWSTTRYRLMGSLARSITAEELARRIRGHSQAGTFLQAGRAGDPDRFLRPCDHYLSRFDRATLCLLASASYGDPGATHDQHTRPALRSGNSGCLGCDSRADRLRARNSRDGNRRRSL